jgi:hypothetical protein
MAPKSPSLDELANPASNIKETNMDRTPGQKLALEMLEQSDAGLSRADIAAAHHTGESSV